MQHLHPVEEDPVNPIKYTKPGPLYHKDGKQYFEPEALINQKTVRGQLQFRVKWKGYPSWRNSWESADSLQTTVPETIQQFVPTDKNKNTRRKTTNWLLQPPSQRSCLLYTYMSSRQLPSAIAFSTSPSDLEESYNYWTEFVQAKVH